MGYKYMAFFEIIKCTAEKNGWTAERRKINSDAISITICNGSHCISQSFQKRLIVDSYVLLPSAEKFINAAKRAFEEDREFA